MPHIVVTGLGKREFDDDRITGMERVMAAACMAVNQLGVMEKDVSFFFPSDPSITSSEVPVIIFV
ncbi:MAG: hypothetical protein EXS52_02130 [Candidatus Staskawiczbacteria bacterium]|nr:hypothetical protein [Candidatus Staskawiczbacteria bacterium]